jgi:F420-non-reducing hydrogenase small subunit
MADKPKVALYWAASCGGCEITVVDLHEKILTVADAVDIVFWPVAIDAKYKDVEAMPDGSILLCLFNGGIRNSEQEHVAKLLRKKSQVMVAFGACAQLGGIPGLANDKSKQAIFNTAYKETFSTENPEGIFPQTSTMVEEGELTLPEFYERVLPLDHVVHVEYYVPGCPPIADQVWNVLTAVLEGNLPPPGSVVGAGNKTCCDECEKTKDEKAIKQFFRPYEIKPDPKKCLLEQGLVCAGPATRSGCGGQCVNVDMPCRGCYGPPVGVADQGAALLCALASVIDSQDPEEIDRIIAQIPDPVGYGWRFSLPQSLLEGRKGLPPMGDGKG